MGRAAQAKRARRAAPPPPVRPPRGARKRRRLAWGSAAFSAVVVAAIVAALLAGRSSPQTVAAQRPSAADRSAPASLVKAADDVGFSPTTEPGVGQIEDEPASAARAPSNPSLVAVGTKAPAFTLKTPQGQTVSLSDYRGKTVLLEFFATWCPHCNAEAPHLKALSSSLKKHGITFLSVNADGETAPSVYAFHRYFGLDYPALVDPGPVGGSFHQPGAAGPVTTAYGVASYPTFYVIDPHGRVAWRSDGEQPDALLRQELLKASRSG